MSFRGDYCDLSTHLWGVKHVVKERKGNARKVIKPHHRASVLTFTFSPLSLSLSPPFFTVLYHFSPSQHQKPYYVLVKMDKPLSQMFR